MEEHNKEMYEMGERLMEMAKAAGYDPNESSEESTETEGSEETSSSASSGDKIGSALSMFNSK